MSDELCFLPLGGCAEIGMNLNAYAFGPPQARRWLIIDVGVTFANERVPGVDLIMADPSFLANEHIVGIILTHAHEDHIGAIAHLWEYLRAPIYASAFTAFLARHKLEEQGLEREAKIRIFAPGDVLELGPFKVSSIALTHSIPEMQALVIDTSLGRLFHTGDWKLDAGPVIGDVVDERALQRIGDTGVLAMICDSTNVFVEGEAGSEISVGEELIRQVAAVKGKVAVAGFASNVARMSSVCEAAVRAGRRVALVGRSMVRMAEAARSVGLLSDVDFITPEDAARLDRERILYLCTGSQGEPRAALARIAAGSHSSVRLEEGDVVIFSSRIIPGNEKSIADIQNALAGRGVRIVTETQANVHVSGHPCRDELARMYGWIRPKIAIPVHGERRHCLEHRSYALSLQVGNSIAPDNGELVRLAPGEPCITDNIAVGRLLLDGVMLIPAGSKGMNERRKIARDGYIVVSLAVAEDGVLVGGPDMCARGYSEADGSLADASIEHLLAAADRALDRMEPEELLDDDVIRDRLSRVLRKAGSAVFGKRPVVDVLTLRV